MQPTQLDADADADAAAAAAGGDIARRAAERYLGVEAPPFLIAPATIADGSGPEGCRFVFPWTFPSGRGNSTALPTHVLPHEIRHETLIRFVFPRTRPDEYGGDAPDWLDEMAAIAFEDAAGVSSRRGEARRFAEHGALGDCQDFRV